MAPPLEAQRNEFTDQLNRSVSLSRDAEVMIRGINGSVTVETAVGLRDAEIRVDIQASSRAASDRRPVLIEGSGARLTIRTEDDEGGSNRRDHVRHNLWVRLPREVSLRVASVNGTVTVSAIDGDVALGSINGQVHVESAGTASRIASINGRTVVALSRIGTNGLSVSSLNGGIELLLPHDASADVDIDDVNGGLDSEVAMTLGSRSRGGRLTGKLGNGGPPITIRSVNGGVSLKTRPERSAPTPSR
jgi:hypothetical protein